MIAFRVPAKIDRHSSYGTAQLLYLRELWISPHNAALFSKIVGQSRKTDVNCLIYNSYAVPRRSGTPVGQDGQ